MINPVQLDDLVIKPVLEALAVYNKRMNSLEVRRLLVATSLWESVIGGETYLRQKTNDGYGVARGIYQMEVATHDDVWENYILNRDKLIGIVGSFGMIDNFTYVTYEGRICSNMAVMGMSRADEMQGNLYYATAMARIHYWRAKGAIPETPEEQYEYYKKNWNSSLGAATKEKCLPAFERAFKEIV